MAIIRRIAATRFGQVHVLSTAGDGVPLLLLHESPRSAAMWGAIQEQLARPTYAPDRLGFGFSDAPPWALSMEQYAQSTMDVIEALRIEAPFDLIGVQMGALEALEIAQQIPEKLHRLGLFSVPLFTADERQQMLAKTTEQPQKPLEDGSHLLATWRGRFAYRKPPYDIAAAQQRFVEFLLATGVVAAQRAIAGFETEKKIRALKMPRVIFAPHDDIGLQIERNKAILSINSSYIDLPDCGPDFLQTDAPRVIDLINTHFDPSRKHQVLAGRA
jgi:pimeloyl-ACP methyl ester carboxylesterase